MIALGDLNELTPLPLLQIVVFFSRECHAALSVPSLSKPGHR